MKAINVNVSVIDGKTVTAVHEAVRTGAGQPVRIQAIAGGKYLLAEGEKGFAPENISLKRVGKDLHIALEGGDLDQPAVIVEGFYEHEGQLVGMAEDSSYYAYVAVDGNDDAGAAFLIEGVPSAQALGGAELVGFGEGLGTLFGGIFSPLVLGLGALGLIGAGVAIGGGGGGGGSSGTPLPAPVPEPEVPAQPEIGQIVDNVGAEQGVLLPGQVTDDTTPTFVGIGQPGDTVTVIDNGTPIGDVVVDENGDWTFTPPPLDEGEHDFVIIVTDPEGNSSEPSVPFPVVIDTTAPVAPDLTEATDDVGAVTGPISSGGVTDDTQPTLGGNGEPGTVVTIIDNGSAIGDALVDEHGQWTFTPTNPLAEGEHVFEVISTDPAGNVSLPSAEYVIIVDTTAPTAPSLGSVADDVGSVTGPIATGEVTDDNQPTLSGEGEPGSTIVIVDNGSPIGDTLVDEDGQWTFTPTDPLAEGEHVFEVISTDPAGNVSVPSGEYVIIVDTVAPTETTLGSVIDDVGSVTGPIAPGDTTDDTQPTLGGGGEPGTTITIIDNGSPIGDTLVDEHGQWVFTPTDPLAEGEHVFEVISTDPAGNVSAPSAEYVVIVDTAAPIAPTLDSVFDDQGDSTGFLVTGDTTDDAKPVLSGTAEAGSTVVILDKGVEIGRAQASASGKWTFTPTTPLSNGSHDLSVQAIDAAGNASLPSDSFDLNVVAGGAPAMPAITAVKDDAGSITGNLQKNDVTDDSTPTLEGTAEAGSTVTLYSNGKLLGTTVTNASGQWSFTPATALADGPHQLTATATNAAGNISPATGVYPITVDTTAPGITDSAVLTDDVGAIQGPILDGSTTDDNLPTFTGTAEPNATVIIYDNGSEIGEAIADNAGNWSFTPSMPLIDGSHSLVTEVVDAAGNVGAPSTPLDFTVDTRGVDISITQVTDDVGSVTGPIAKGDVTDDTTPTLSGKATAGGIVKLYANGTIIGQTTADALGNWSFTPTVALADGVHNLTATVTTDAAGESAPTSAFDLTVDSTAPTTASIDAALDDVGTVQGTVANGAYTDDTTPSLSGQGEPGSVVTVYDNAGELGSVTVANDGTWTFTPSPLNDGEHVFTVISIDPAGNVSVPSAEYVVIVDTTAPVQPTLDTVFDDQGDSTGFLATGDTTDDAKPVLSGTAEAGSTVVILDKGVEIGRAQASASGKWTFTPTTPLSNGSHDLSVQAIDAAGNASLPSDSFDLHVVAGGAPAMPAITAVKDDAGSITGNLQKNDVTDDSTPTLEGTAEAGSTVTLYSNGKLLGTTVTNASGQWSFTPATALADGTHRLTATATNAAGNISPATGVYPIVVDTTAPGITDSAVLTDDVGSIQGPIADGSVTDDNLPTFTGTAEANATVIIYDNGSKIGEATTDSTGNWSFTPSTPLTDGPHSFITEVIDPAGNVGAPSVPLDFEVDTRAVDISITQVIDDVGSQQGKLAKGDVTDDTTPTLSGKATAGGIVKLYDNGTLIGQTTALTPWATGASRHLALSQGVHNLTATVTTDAAGESAPTSAFDLSVDSIAPTAASIDAALDDVGTVQGTVANGAYTDDTTPTLSGQGEPGSVITLYDAGDELGSVNVANDGTWTFTPSPLNDGEHVFTVISIDPAGNASAPSAEYVVNIDTLAPLSRADVTSMSKDSGFDSGDWLTNDGSAGRLMQGSLSAALAAHETVQVSTDGGLTWIDALVNGVQWSAQDNNAHDADWQIQVRVVDSAGQVGGTLLHDVFFDNTAPDAPTSVTASGSSLTVTFDKARVEIGDWITVVNGDERIYHQVVQADKDAGSLVIGIPAGVDPSLVVSIVDRAGNASAGVQLSSTIMEEFLMPGGNISHVATAFGSVTREDGSMSLWSSQNGALVMGTPGTTSNPYIYSNATVRFDLNEEASQISLKIGWVNYGTNYLRFYDKAGVELGAIHLSGNQWDPAFNGFHVYTFSSGTGNPVAYFKYSAISEMNGIQIDWIQVDVVRPGVAASDVLLATSDTHVGSSSGDVFLYDHALDQPFTVKADGGQGLDTLKMIAAGQVLDLNEAAIQLSSVEIFDLTGTGDNTLKLSLADVLENGAENLFTEDGSVQMMIKGDAGDRVDLSDLLGESGMDTGDWSTTSQLINDGVVYHVYQHSGMAAEVLVQDGVQVNLV